jgi:quercetin dioxygenase-like cupin family protein
MRDATKEEGKGSFRTREVVESERLAHGLHHWVSRRDLTGSEQLILVRVEMEPGKAHAFHRHPTMEEIIYVISGEAEQWVHTEHRVLGPGEAAFIPQDVVHGTYNAADEPLVFLAILSPARELDATATVDVSADEPWRSLRAPAA